MKKRNRILALALSATLLAGLLAGCTKPEGTTTPTPTPSASPSATGDVAGSVPMVTTEDAIEKLVGVPKDTAMFTVDGAAVTAEQLYYWLGYTIDGVGYASFNGAENIDWTQEQDGKSISQYILESAKQTAQLYSVMETKAAQEGVALTDKDRAALELQISNTIEQVGGEEEYAKWLGQIAMSDEGFRHMYSTSFLYAGIRDKRYGEGGKQPTEEEIVAYAEGQGLMLVKHILLKTKEADRTTPLSDEAIAAAKQKAEGLLSQLQAAAPAELEALFDKLMEENSEDGRNADGTLASPDGYLFGAGMMHQEFEDGAKALAYNQISGLVETSDGYHIILRLKPQGDDVPLDPYGRSAESLADLWIDKQLNDVVDGWMTAAKVEDGPEMAKVNVKGFYDKLSAYRDSLAPPQETTPPAESLAPTEPSSPSPTPAG